MKPAKRNPMAKELANPLFRIKIAKSLKGKGSYNRKKRHLSKMIDGASFFVCDIWRDFYNEPLFVKEGEIHEDHQGKAGFCPVRHNVLFGSPYLSRGFCLRH